MNTTLRFFSIFLLLGSVSLQAQFTKVNLDFESAYISENDALPAEVNLLFSGAIPTYIDRIEFNILPRRGAKAPLHTAVWQRPLDNSAAVYSLPVNYKLRPSSQYDIEVLFFRSVTSAQREELIKTTQNRLGLFLESQREPANRGFKWQEKPKRLLQGMNELLRQDLSNYRAGISASQSGLSALIALQLEKMEGLRMPADSAQAAALQAQEQQTLQQLMEGELRQIIGARLYQVADSRYLEDCPTEEKRGAIAVNAGFGGAYFSGNLDKELDYGTAPYAGLSFPLGNSAFAPRFLSNTYLGFGLFLQDFENAKDETLTGPIVGRPIYASLDHKLFQFVYLNIGATLLEQSNSDDSKTLLVRPFIGLSAKVNLSLSFER
ncbi:hypothetical protein [Phaeodactylibacter luteus]|uniref:Uncharacterized protein n=1 Tax=Phaeodactylibacter luteus TaxID=1564516 RepID=A0A5C6RLZ9_9BACT|nr:hypothetical protein [Phaeodactylibacter luteus]TXB62984.1 hypothetical protein FRY97_11630 [Phaeodactylibacter luteus]